jgi:hypothetical protein
MSRRRGYTVNDPGYRLRIELALVLGPSPLDELRGIALTDEELEDAWWQLRARLLAQSRAMGVKPPWAYLRFECDSPAERPKLGPVDYPGFIR